MANHPPDASCNMKEYESRSLTLDQKCATLTNVEKSSKDGYNWRKYDQKLVTGSEFPQNYYRCTHPSCPVKKKVERSHNGLVTIIIYEGVHDHPKPQPSRRQSVGASSMAQEGDDKVKLVLPASTGITFNQLEADGTPEPSSLPTIDGEGGEGTTAGHGDKLEDDDEGDPVSKRRRTGSASMDRTLTIRTIREPRVIVQTVSKVDILDDGYKWRKYGQKVVKGNPNPRSYYKCSNAGCAVRKHVERANHDPESVITIYEGKHNHDVPTANSTGVEVSMLMTVQGASTLNGSSPMDLSSMMLRPTNHIENGRVLLFPTAPNVFGLDLGADIGRVAESSFIQKRNLTEAENMTKHIHGAYLTKSDPVSPIQSVGTLPFYENGTIKQPAHCYRELQDGDEWSTLT